MRTRMPLNESGMSLLAVLITFTVVGLAAAGIILTTQQKRKIIQQINVSITAEVIRNKLMGYIMTPESWQKIQAQNTSVFTPFDINAPNKLDIYAANSDTPFYKSTENKWGFNFEAEPCQTFNSDIGDNSCPFRYEVRLKDRKNQSGAWIDTLTLTLKFNPRDKNFIVNTQQANLSFDFVRNWNVESSETSCVSLNGIYDVATASCSRKITMTSTCNGGATYRGPASTSQPTCSPVNIQNTQCSGEQVIKGFDTQGNPICGEAL